MKKSSDKSPIYLSFLKRRLWRRGWGGRFQRLIEKCRRFWGSLKWRAWRKWWWGLKTWRTHLLIWGRNDSLCFLVDFQDEIESLPASSRRALFKKKIKIVQPRTYSQKDAVQRLFQATKTRRARIPPWFANDQAFRTTWVHRKINQSDEIAAQCGEIGE